MSAIEQVEMPPLSDPMTWDEICARYPDMWVDLVEIVDDVPFDLAFQTARVSGHGATRREAIAQGRPWFRLLRHSWCRYTGKSRLPSPFLRLP